MLLETGTIVGTKELRQIEKANLADAFSVELPETKCETNEDILTLFGEVETVELPTRETLFNRMRVEVETIADENGKEYESTRKRVPYALADIKDGNGKTIVAAFHKIDREGARKIENLALPTLEILYVNNFLVATLETDSAVISKATALIDIYKKIRPSDPATPESAASLMRSIFFDLRRYDLAKVGRYKMNKKLGLSLPLSIRNITREDVVAMIKYIIRLAQSDPEVSVDDIDHLENKRVRSVGELLYSQLRLGFLRMEKVAKERMTSMDTENILPQVVLSVKPISASIKSFFGSSQLSQFMDQTNPLAELGHKRRLSALGPGGLSRQSAKLEVRDVHHSHYGRICPIETPEGPNIGLIGQLTVHARVDEFGFIETPYRRVINGVVQQEIDWLPADGEHLFRIAPANARINEDKSFTTPMVQVRHHNEYPTVSARRDRLHGRRAPAIGFSRDGDHSVPGERRREPRLDGREHAAPSRPDPAPLRAAGQDRHGKARRRRLRRGDRRAARRRRPARDRRRDHRRVRCRPGRHVSPDEHDPLEPIDVRHAAPDRFDGPAGPRGQRLSRRSLHRRRRTRPWARTFWWRSCPGKATTLKTRFFCLSAWCATTCTRPFTSRNTKWKRATRSWGRKRSRGTSRTSAKTR